MMTSMWAPILTALLWSAGADVPPGSQPMPLRDILKLDVNASNATHDPIENGACSNATGPACKAYSVDMARAFVTLTKAGQCGPNEHLKQWSCSACRDVGFDVVPDSSREVLAKEITDPNATSIYMAQVKGSFPNSKPRPAEPVSHKGEDCLSHCRKTAGYCQWCGVGNACCLGNSTSGPEECKGAHSSTGNSQYECVAPSPKPKEDSEDVFGCVLSVRGSKNLPNGIMDALFFLTDMQFGEECPGCKANLGFLRIWHGIEREVLDNLSQMGCVPGGPRGNLLVTGHSLGAAVAQLAMFHLQAKGYNVVLSYNFESPRTGNRAWAKAFKDWFGRDVATFRVTHKHDIVPRVPPQLNPLPNLDFAHVASEVFYPAEDDNDFKVCEENEDPQCADRNNWAECLILDNKFQDHCKGALAADHDLCSCPVAGAGMSTLDSSIVV